VRILIVAKFLHVDGGVETYLNWQVRALVNAGVEVGLVGMRPDPKRSLMDFPALPVWLTPTRTFAAGDSRRVPNAAASVYSVSARKVMDQALTQFRPDAVHFHTTCFHLSPSVVSAAVARRLPLFLTSHEYKLICTNQLLYDDRRQEICTDCLAAGAATALSAPIRRACVKGSRVASTVAAVEGLVAGRIWRRAAPHIFAPSRFMATMLKHDGWPAAQVEYLDLPWPEPQPSHGSERRRLVYVGRLVAGKGVATLVEAWRRIAEHHPDIELRIVGDGVERPALEQQVADTAVPRTQFTGRVPVSEIPAELAAAVITAQPARWHDNSPLAVRESLVAGVPAVVSALGGMPELVGPSSGYVVDDGSPTAWARTLDLALRERRVNSPELVAEVAGRRMTAARHLEIMIDSYGSRMREWAAR
jgi:glycosyltransferase involved in cell wall biosynthesis